MRGFHEFRTFVAATRRHAELTRLGWRPFSVFQTAKGGWAFWV